MKPSPLAAWLRRALALASLTALGSSTALSATWYWDSDAVASGAQQSSGTWQDGASTWWDGAATVPWNNAAAPGNIAHFGTSTGAGIAAADDASRTITVSGTVNAAGLIFNTSTSGHGYILSGGEIDLADGSTIDILGLNTTNNPERRHQILSAISGADINITRSANTGASFLSMLQLRGSNTWTGTLSLSSSSSGLFVEAYNGSALNTLSSISVGADSVMVLATADAITTDFSISGTGPGNRGAIRFDVSSGVISGDVTLTGDAGIAAQASGTISGNIGESGGARVLTINPGTNGGAVTLSGTNTHSGGTILNAGTLNINSATALGTGNFTINGGTINNNSGATVTTANTNIWNGNFAFTGTNSLSFGTAAVSLGTAAGTARTVTVNGGSLTVGGVISNGTTATGLTKAGGGVLNFSGTAANTYTGLTTVSGGGLSLGKTAGVNAIAGDVRISGGTLRFTANNQIADTAAVTVTSGGFNSSDAANVNNGLSDLKETIGSLTVSGTGLVNLNGAAANLVVNGAASFTGGGGATFFMGSGGSFSADSLTIADMSRTTSTGLTTANNNNGFVVYGNNATQSVVKVGAGGLTLSGVNSLNHMILRAGTNGSRLSLDGDVTTTGTLGSNIIRDSAGSTPGATLVALSATQTGAVTRTFNVGGGGADLTIGPDVSVTNGVSSSASLTKTGAGTLTLNGTNTYTGATNVNDGKLRLGGGINSTTIAVTGATLELLNSNVLANNAALTLNNALLIAGGPTETLGTLTITGNNQLDLVTVGNAIFFANSSSTLGSGNLAILNWAAQAFGGTGDNQLFFGNNAGGLDEATQLSKISFIDPTIDGVVQTGTFGAMILASGEVVAVIPEASSALLVLLGSSVLLGRRRRK